jgi:GT2 family glycosyltransferase
VVSFFDDDVVLEPNYLKNIISVFSDERFNDVAGVTGRITNYEKPRLNIIKRMFILDTAQKGKILSSGFNVRNFDWCNSRIYVEWIPGGMSSFRRSIFYEFKFDENYSQEGAGREDIDFSYRVAKKYRLLYEPSARLLHRESTISRTTEAQFGRIQILERLYFIKKNKPFFLNKLAFSKIFLRPFEVKRVIERLKGNFKGIGVLLCCRRKI